MKQKQRYFFFYLFFILSLTSCNDLTSKNEITKHKNATSVNSYIQDYNQRKNLALDAFLNSLSLEEKISQLFISNIDGSIEFYPNEYFEKDKNKAVIPGAYLFFAFNLASTPEQIINFTDSVYEYTQKNNLIPPFLSIDHEGGTVNRLKNINAPLISSEDMAKKYSLVDSINYYKLQAIQLKNLGFDLNLAPVVEICTKENTGFLNGRSFGDEKQVTEYSIGCVNAYQNNGVATVIKHFPGNTNTDPHRGLPVIDKSKEEIMKDLIPFIKVMDIFPDGILMSHAIVPSVDSLPSCLSYTWVTKILREELGYKGIIFSDDIYMAALLKNGYPPQKAVIMAIDAGIDCIMISGKFINEPINIISEKYSSDKDFATKVENACKRMIEYKIKNGLLEYKLQNDSSIKILQNNSFNKEKQKQDFINAKNENLKLIGKNER